MGTKLAVVAAILVLGAGVAGLACARELARAGRPCVVLERSRGVGGRCATRRIEGQAVDHGIALLHARTPGFAAVLRELPSEGLIEGWPRAVRETRLACQPEAFGGEQRREAAQGRASQERRHASRRPTTTLSRISAA